MFTHYEIQEIFTCYIYTVLSVCSVELCRLQIFPLLFTKKKDGRLGAKVLMVAQDYSLHCAHKAGQLSAVRTVTLGTQSRSVVCCQDCYTGLTKQVSCLLSGLLHWAHKAGQLSVVCCQNCYTAPTKQVSSLLSGL